MARETSALEADGKVVWSWRPDAGVKVAGLALRTTGAKEPGPRGERDISRKTIARGMPGVSGVTVMTCVRATLSFARKTAGASGARHSLRPLL